MLRESFFIFSTVSETFLFLLSRELVPLAICPGLTPSIISSFCFCFSNVRSEPRSAGNAYLSRTFVTIPGALYRKLRGALARDRHIRSSRGRERYRRRKLELLTVVRERDSPLSGTFARVQTRRVKRSRGCWLLLLVSGCRSSGERMESNDTATNVFTDPIENEPRPPHVRNTGYLLPLLLRYKLLLLTSRATHFPPPLTQHLPDLISTPAALHTQLSGQNR